jgi:hypothetical protein
MMIALPLYDPGGPRLYARERNSEESWLTFDRLSISLEFSFYVNFGFLCTISLVAGFSHFCHVKVVLFSQGILARRRRTCSWLNESDAYTHL